MMFPKNRIRLSRSLRAQTNPYPGVVQWVKRGFWIFFILLVVGIYFFARPSDESGQQQAEFPDDSKQILGEQEAESENPYIIHQVNRGDTLFNLSVQYNVAWEKLAEFNNLDEPYILKIGQEIKIPR